MRKILLLHGWSSDGSTKTIFLRSLGFNVATPRLSHWSFTRAVRTAQAAFDAFHPDVIVASSRGGAVAMNMDSSDTPLVLLAPAWRRRGKATSVKTNCVVIHSIHDEFVSFQDSVELCGKSGARLVAAGKDHRLNCEEGRRAVERALGLALKVDFRLISTPLSQLVSDHSGNV